MSYTATVSDWEACPVAQVGGAAYVGAGTYVYEFRSKLANWRGPVNFTGVGIGVGGSIGGATAPSPGNVVTNTQPSLFTAFPCLRAFSADDLDSSSGQITTISVSAMYGYAKVKINAGTFKRLFRDADVSGWGVGVGANGTIFVGKWTCMGTGSNYY